MQVKDLITRLEKAGGQFVVPSIYRHPTFKRFFKKDSKKVVFDLEKTSSSIKDTMTYIENLGMKGEVILFVCSRKESLAFVENVAKSLSLPFVINRWIGGVLSNFSNIRSRVDRLLKLREEVQSNQKNLTKKQKVLRDREIARLEEKFSGIVNLKAKPAAVFILDVKKEVNAVNEANKVGVPVIGFSNANADLSLIQYPIVANINSREVVSTIMDLVLASYKKGVQSKK